MPTMELPSEGGRQLSDGEHTVRLEWATALVNSAQEGGMALDWTTAFGYVTTVRELYGLPLLPERHAGGAPSVLDVVRDPGGLFGTLEALETCMRHGRGELFRLAILQAAELPGVMRRGGALEGGPMYAGLLGVEPFEPDIVGRLVAEYRADGGPELVQALQAQVRTFDPASNR